MNFFSQVLLRFNRSLLATRFKSVDPWEEKIKTWLKEYRQIGYVRVEDILAQCLQIEEAKWTRKEARRISDILTSLGWQGGKKKWINGRNLRIWVAPPKPKPEPELKPEPETSQTQEHPPQEAQNTELTATSPEFIQLWGVRSAEEFKTIEAKLGKQIHKAWSLIPITAQERIINLIDAKTQE